MSVVPFESDSEIAAAIPRAVAHLHENGVLAHPTETIYGLGSALVDGAVANVAALKARANDKPFVILIAGLEMLSVLGLSLTRDAERLATRHWPGALTLVLPAGDTSVPRSARSATGVAVRWTPHAGIAQVVRAFGAPITSTSANRSGLPPAVSAAEIAKRWHAEVVSGALMVLDGGAAQNLLPSTIVDCSGARPFVLRAGRIGLATLRETIPGLVGEV